MEYAVNIQGLKKSFGSNEVLKEINLKLAKGDNIAIIGRSGTGKSVLTKCIVGLINPDEGEMEVLGKNINKLDYYGLTELRKRIGYLFQGGALYDSMSVRDNLEFPLRRTYLAKEDEELNQKIEDALRDVGLLDAMNKMPSELSGGMRKRIALARTIIMRPEIILYDEPTTGLDPVTSGEISELIVSIQEKFKTSSIIVTHDMKCVKITSNQLKLLEGGLFLTEGTYNELSKSDDPNLKAFFS